MTGSYPKVFNTETSEWTNLLDNNFTIDAVGGITSASPQADDIFRYVAASSEYINAPITTVLQGKTLNLGTINASSGSISGNLVVGSTLTVNGVLITGGGGSGSVSTEQVQDAAAPLLDHAFHTNITASYDDANNRVLLTTVANPTTEDIQDAAAPLLNHAFHTNVTASYDDANNRVLLTSTASAAVPTETIQDAAAQLFDHAFHTRLTATYDDANNRVLLTANLPSGASAQTNFYDVVRDYGVVSGEADSATKIQNALYAARDAGGGIVYIPTGTYNLGSRLEIYEGTTLLSSQKATLSRNHTSNLIINGLAGASYSGYNGQGNIKIIGGIWDNKGPSYPVTPAMGISIGHGQNIIIQDLTVKDTAGFHAIEINSSKNVRISNCRLIGFVDTGSRGYSEAIQIDLAKSSAVFGAFGSYDNTSCEDVVIENCYFGPSGTSGTTAWPTGVGSHSYTAGFYHTNTKITKNHFDSLTEYAIRTYVVYKNLIIDSNTIQSCYGGITIGLDGGANHTTTTQTVPQQSQNITVSNNLILDTNGTNAIAFWNTDGAIVTGNQIKNVTRTGSNLGDGILFVTVVDGVIANNRVEDTSQDSIDVRTNSSAIMVANNITKDPSQVTTNTHNHIYFNDSVTNSSIIANRGFKEGSNIALNGILITGTCSGMRAFGNHYGSAATNVFNDSSSAVTSTTNA
jgi:hypothetical protein